MRPSINFPRDRKDIGGRGGRRKNYFNAVLLVRPLINFPRDRRDIGGRGGLLTMFKYPPPPRFNRHPPKLVDKCCPLWRPPLRASFDWRMLYLFENVYYYYCFTSIVSKIQLKKEEVVAEVMAFTAADRLLLTPFLGCL